MGIQNWSNPLVTATTDGSTVTATGVSSCLPGSAKYTLPSNFFTIGKALRVTASGRISCAATTPGTARFDMRFTSNVGTIVVFDTLAMNLNAAGKTAVAWRLELDLICRTVGNSTNATLFGEGKWMSEAGVGAPPITAGGVALFLVPYNVAPVAGNGFDSTLPQTVDMAFTQTVGTGSMTLHQYLLEEIG